MSFGVKQWGGGGEERGEDNRGPEAGKTVVAAPSPRITHVRRISMFYSYGFKLDNFCLEFH